METVKTLICQLNTMEGYTCTSRFDEFFSSVLLTSNIFGGIIAYHLSETIEIGDSKFKNQIKYKVSAFYDCFDFMVLLFYERKHGTAYLLDL